jgi:hypothetical protein
MFPGKLADVHSFNSLRVRFKARTATVRFAFLFGCSAADLTCVIERLVSGLHLATLPIADQSGWSGLTVSYLVSIDAMSVVFPFGTNPEDQTL